MNVNVNLIVENVTQIKGWITINVDLSVKIWKNIVCANKIIFGILLHVIVKMVNRKYCLVITYDEIIEETKTAPTKTCKK